MVPGGGRVWEASAPYRATTKIESTTMTAITAAPVPVVVGGVAIDRIPFAVGLRAYITSGRVRPAAGHA